MGVGLPLPPYLCFNPHSSFRPSATASTRCPNTGGRRFNPHSSFRPSATQDRFVAVKVRKFQSSLELSPECNSPGWRSWCRARCFNPHSSFRPSATLSSEARIKAGYGVSILTRAFARVQRGGEAERRRGAISFNPHSSFRPSATSSSVQEHGFSTFGFNPHSSFRPSATQSLGAFMTALGFNPHSSFRPSATLALPKLGD